MSKWCISDTHGCYLTMLALIEKVKEKDPKAEFIFTGDYVDRGPRSAEVVEFIIEGIKSGEFQGVRGNHEGLMYEFFLARFGSNWLGSNGGTATVDSYRDYYNLEDDDLWEKIEEDAKELQTLPLYLMLDDEDEQGRKLLISHAFCSDFIDDYLMLHGGTKEENDVAVDAYEEEHGIFARCKITKCGNLFDWNRNIPEKENKKYFNITGHNITGHLLQRYGSINGYDKETEVIVDKEKGYACIDTGAFVDERYQNDFGGKMTAISFPGLEIIQQQNIDKVDKDV